MATKHFITPFPPEIDRTYFGAWLSGFTDGEGCFRLGFYKRLPYARFHISLRDDDSSILELIRSFFGCGTPVMHHKKSARKTRPISDKEAPTASYGVKNIQSLHDVVIPHFVNYPLLAKKGNDFIIWSDAVRFLYNRMNVIRCDIRGRYWKGYHLWTPRDLHKFNVFVHALKEIRRFKT